MTKAPLAFFSYVHDDDTQDNGRLTRIRERLQGEISMHWGSKVEIFQDRDMRWGTAWDQCIKNSLDSTAFLIPVVTPRYFQSGPCREELVRFFERERMIGRNDLILPLYYLRARPMEDGEARQGDPVAELLSSRQYTDFRSLRHEPETSPEVGKALTRMAEHIVESLYQQRVPGSRPAKAPVAENRESSEAKVQPDARSERPNVGAAPKDPPSVVVDWMGRGDFSTITDAIKAAKPGTRILVRPGTYREGLVIDKALEIIGDGQRDEIVVEAKGKNAVLFKAGMGRVSNLTLRQGADGDWPAVDVTQGRLELADCEISSESHTCIAVHDGADPVIRSNCIHDGKMNGVFVYSKGRGTIENNKFVDNGLAGIEIKSGGDPVVRRNQIQNAKRSGVVVHSEGRGIIEHNEFTGNFFTGVEINSGGNPVVRQNTFKDGVHPGVYQHSKGQGTIEDNVVVANAFDGLNAKAFRHPKVENNNIVDKKGHGVLDLAGSADAYESNGLLGSTTGGMSLLGETWYDLFGRGNKEK